MHDLAASDWLAAIVGVAGDEDGGAGAGVEGAVSDRGLDAVAAGAVVAGLRRHSGAAGVEPLDHSDGGAADDAVVHGVAAVDSYGDDWAAHYCSSSCWVLDEAVACLRPD